MGERRGVMPFSGRMCHIAATTTTSSITATATATIVRKGADRLAKEMLSVVTVVVVVVYWGFFQAVERFR